MKTRSIHGASGGKLNAGKSLKVLIVGAGGVGGYFGAALAKAGNDVTFLVRGKQLDAFRNHGLKVSSATKGDFTIDKVKAITDASDAGKIDVAILGVKAWQVKEAAQLLKKLPNSNYVVLPLQNGVDAYNDLTQELPADNIVGGSCQIISYIEKPGHIVHVGVEPKIVLGEWNNTRSERIKSLVSMLTDAGMEVENPESIQKALWEKFLFIASVGGVGSVTRANYGQMRSCEPTAEMLRAAMHEVCTLAQASGVALSDTTVEKTMNWIAKVPANGTPSMERDIMDAKPSELENLSGAVARRGKEVGVATPVHSFIYASLLPMELEARR